MREWRLLGIRSWQSPTVAGGQDAMSAAAVDGGSASAVEGNTGQARRAMARKGGRRRVETQQHTLDHLLEGQSSRWWTTMCSSRLPSHKNACVSLARVLHPTAWHPPFAFCLSMATLHLASHPFTRFLFTAPPTLLLSPLAPFSHSLSESVVVFTRNHTPSTPPLLLRQAQEVRKDKRET